MVIVSHEGRERRVYLIRHGRPRFPGGERYCLGTSDFPLGGLGRLQALLCARYMERANVTAVFSSPLSRARDTAAFLGEPVVLPGLAELDAGDWDGLSFKEIRERWPELYKRRGSEPGLQPPGAETPESGLLRFMSALDEALSRSEGDIAVVSHATVTQNFLALLEGVPLGRSLVFKPPYCGVTELSYDNGRYRIESRSEALPELDPELCRALLRLAGTPERVIAHCEAVEARTAELLAALDAAGLRLDAETTLAAARLHDIARPDPDHAEVGAGLLSELGYPKVARLISSHHEPSAVRLNEAAVLCLADETTLETRRVTLDERFSASCAKCGSPEALANWQRRYEAAKSLASEINAKCERTVIE